MPAARVSFAVSMIKILHALSDGVPRCVSDIARKSGVNWKTANKALDLLMDVDEVHDGRTIRKQIIGSNKVYTIVDKPTVQHGNEVDITMFFKMRSDLNDIVEILGKDEISDTTSILDDCAYTWQTEYLPNIHTLISKTINTINTVIEPTGFIEDDVFELHRARSMINEALDSYDDDGCDTLLVGLTSLFTGEWIAESDSGKQVKKDVSYMLSRTGKNSKTTLRRMRTIITKAIGKRCGVKTK